MLFKLFLLFIVTPLIELVLLLLLAEATAWWVSVLVVIVTGTVGLMLARRQGWHTFDRIRTEIGQGRVPADALLDGLLILLAGALLATPGLLTDAVGMSMLLPPCRAFYKSRLSVWWGSRFRLHTPFTKEGFAQGGFTPHDVADESETNFGESRVIDSYVVEAKKSEETDSDAA